MKNMPHVLLQERVFSASIDSLGKRMILRPEKNSAKYMMNLVLKFCKPGERILSTCATTVLSARTCLQLQEHRLFIGCEKDSICFQDALPSIVEL